jgi:hypothetical protein
MRAQKVQMFGSLDEKCQGCEKIIVGKGCPVFATPAEWWRRGGCPMATHWKAAVSTVAEVKRVGQQKHKKRGKDE